MNFAGISLISQEKYNRKYFWHSNRPCNILGFRATKNTSFLKIFLQLCEACSIYVEPESSSLTRRCIHIELVAGVCSCSWVGFVLSCGVRSTQVHSNLLSNSLGIHLWVSSENPPLIYSWILTLNSFQVSIWISSQFPPWPHVKSLPESLSKIISQALFKFSTRAHRHASQKAFELISKFPW
jgi:hypothetical protein